MIIKFLLLTLILCSILAPATAANNTSNVSSGEKAAEADLNNTLQFFTDIIVFVFIILALAIIGGGTK